MQGKDQAIKHLASWVALREGEHIHAQVVLTDGAESLQRHVLTKLAGFTLVLNIIHVDEHVWEAGTAIHGETDPHRAEWVEVQMFDILSSRNDQVIQRLEDTAVKLSPSGQAAKTLRRVANYLQRNQPYMDYAEYLRRGWPTRASGRIGIGTGVIEGTCRHLVKDRMELSGMHWTLSGAGAELIFTSLLCLYVSFTFPLLTSSTPCGTVLLNTILSTAVITARNFYFDPLIPGGLSLECCGYCHGERP